MHFTDSAIILSVRRLGETTGIVRAFSERHGLIAGAVRGVSGKRGRGVWQPGNFVLVSWAARLSEQLGTLTGELIAPGAARAMQHKEALALLLSACALTEALLPERQAHPALYAALEGLASSLGSEAYCRFELALLSECGFRLDLSACAATGSAEDLAYVSPRSGRAVSCEAGAPYKEKLLKLPVFLHRRGQNAPPEPAEILAAFNLTGYFLEHWLFAPHGKKIPAARLRLGEHLHQNVILQTENV